MNMIILSFLFLISGAIIALIFSNKAKEVTVIKGGIEVILKTNNQVSAKISVPFIITGCLFALIPTVQVLLSGHPESFILPFNSYYGTFGMEIDSLSAFFLLPVLIISLLGAVYGYEYMKPYFGADKTWFFYSILIAGMMGVVMARNGVLFLLFWEIMSLSSFFLVSFENHKPEVRSASLIYLIAAHMGAAFLLMFFALMWVKTGSLDFNNFGALSPLFLDIFFLLAVIGFGTKAGFIFLHVWLPEAHPAAPSHVSAIMSGVMVKTGIYGILRVLMLLGVVHAWWGWFLIITGAASGLFSILFSLAQRDFKKLLAYSTVENIGIITMGIGLGILGMSHNEPFITVLGFGGSLIHIINHSFLKSLLFMGAGSVLHSTGTRDIEKLGGLIKYMPWTAANFFTGSVAIAGLPPLNGFIGEFLIYLGAFHALTTDGKSFTTFGVIIIISLALIGALTVLSFTRAFGITFLGNLREQKIRHIHESGNLMLYSMTLLSAACIFIGLGAPFILKFLIPVIKDISFVPLPLIEVQLVSLNKLLLNLSLVFLLFLLIIAGLTLISKNLRNKRIVRQTQTWSCGYSNVTPRMQYTAYSFSKPVTDLFSTFIRAKRKVEPVQGLFPEEASLISVTPDVFHHYFFRTTFLFIEKLLSRFKWIQHGNLQLYVFYITITLIILLVWKVH
jgi:hydrogenase-4 component B